MITATFLLADSFPYRALLEVELPTVPGDGEQVGFAGRTYRVVERSWRITSEDGKVASLGCGLLVTQLSGPPHVITAPGEFN